MGIFLGGVTFFCTANSPSWRFYIISRIFFFVNIWKRNKKANNNLVKQCESFTTADQTIAAYYPFLIFNE